MFIHVYLHTGVDVVYESVGGAMFDTCVNALAQHGRLIVIGWISGYETDKGFNVSRTLGSLPQRLLPKCASVRGFFLFGYPKEIKVSSSLAQVLALIRANTLAIFFSHRKLINRTRTALINFLNCNTI